jgi:type IV secretion system protein VirD4
MFLELDTSKAAYTLHNVAKYARQFTTEGYKKMLDSLKPESVSKIYLTEVLSGKDGGLTSAISTAHNALKMFLSESIAHLTSKATFSMEELITKPTILYIRFGEYKEVATLLMALCYKNLNSYLEDNHVFSFERPIHYIVDEFGNLPKMEFVSKIFSLDRSKNIFALLTLQSKSQLLAIYGRERTQELIDSAQATIICSLSDIEFAGELSRKAGMSLRKTTSTSEGKDKDSGSKTTQEQAFKNVEESDFINKESDEMIVVLSGERPYKFKFIPF